MKSVGKFLKPYLNIGNDVAKKLYMLVKKMLKETKDKRFDLLIDKIKENLSFDKNIKTWFEKFFLEQ